MSAKRAEVAPEEDQALESEPRTPEIAAAESHLAQRQAELDALREQVAGRERELERTRLDAADLRARQKAVVQRAASGEDVAAEQRQVREALAGSETTQQNLTEVLAELARQVGFAENRWTAAAGSLENARRASRHAELDRRSWALDAAFRAVEERWREYLDQLGALNRAGGEPEHLYEWYQGMCRNLYHVDRDSGQLFLPDRNRRGW